MPRCLEKIGARLEKMRKACLPPIRLGDTLICSTTNLMQIRHSNLTPTFARAEDMLPAG